MDLFLIARTLDIVGKVLIAYTAIMVHHRFSKEHRVDEKVFQEMKREKVFGIIGISFMVMAYIFEIYLHLI